MGDSASETMSKESGTGAGNVGLREIEASSPWEDWVRMPHPVFSTDDHRPAGRCPLQPVKTQAFCEQMNSA
jgi:hypothetical protein